MNAHSSKIISPWNLLCKNDILTIQGSVKVVSVEVSPPGRAAQELCRVENTDFSCPGRTGTARW